MIPPAEKSGRTSGSTSARPVPTRGWTARRDGDASPDGLAHGFEGAESPKDLVAPPDDDPDSEPVPHLPPQLKALEWLDTMGSPDDVPPIDR